MSNEIDSLSAVASHESRPTGQGRQIPTWNITIYPMQGKTREGHKHPFKEQGRFMLTMLGTKTHVIFLSWSMGLFVWRWGVYEGMNRGGYSSMQGSKISKPEGCGEDGEGWCSGRVFWGLAFVPTPSTRIPWKDHQAGWFVTALGSPFWLVTAAKQMLELQRGVWMIPAPRSSHTAGMVTQHQQFSHTQPAEAGGPRGSQHTPLARVTLKDRLTLYHRSLMLPYIKCFGLNYVSFWKLLWVLTDRAWIHFKMLLAN